MAENNTNLFPHSSRVQKAEIIVYVRATIPAGALEKVHLAFSSYRHSFACGHISLLLLCHLCACDITLFPSLLTTLGMALKAHLDNPR